jgi:hypothetical protein
LAYQSIGSVDWLFSSLVYFCTLFVPTFTAMAETVTAMAETVRQLVKASSATIFEWRKQT